MKIIDLRLRPLLLAFIFFSATGWDVHSQELYRFEVVKVTESIFQLESSNILGDWVTGNTTVIINDKDVFVVDAGFLPSVAKATIREIKKLTDKPVAFLFNTHWHGDHWQGNAEFKSAYPDVKIVSTEEALNGMKTKGMFWLKKNYLKIFENRIATLEKTLASGSDSKGVKLSSDVLPKIKDTLAACRRELSELRQVVPIYPELTFTKNMFIKSGSREIQLHYLGWGNTTGDGVIYLPQEKILIAGDLVVSPAPYESGSFSAEWLKIFKKLKEFPFTSLLPGHGVVEHNSDYLDYLIALFELIIREVNKAVLDGQTLDETKKLVTHKFVTDELSTNPKFLRFIKDFEPAFLTVAINRAYPKAQEGKL